MRGKERRATISSGLTELFTKAGITNHHSTAHTDYTRPLTHGLYFNTSYTQLSLNTRHWLTIISTEWVNSLVFSAVLSFGRKRKIEHVMHFNTSSEKTKWSPNNRLDLQRWCPCLFPIMAAYNYSLPDSTMLLCLWSGKPGKTLLNCDLCINNNKTAPFMLKHIPLFYHFAVVLS